MSTVPAFNAAVTVAPPTGPVAPPVPDEPIDGHQLAVDIRAFIDGYVALPTPAASVVLTIWVMHTHAIDAAECTVYLQVSSAEKRSGKSRALETVELLVQAPVRTVGASVAALFRLLDERPTPTLLFDESDTIFGASRRPDAEDIRGLLNAGYRRGSGFRRCERIGNGPIRVAEFETFSPKIIAGIGDLPDTIEDRSLRIRMRRKRADQQVRRFRRRVASVEAEHLRTLAAGWAAQNIEILTEAEPDLPDDLDDRLQDGAEPMLAIADLIGGDWPPLLRSALSELAAERTDAEEDSLGVRLLADIRRIFEERGIDRITSARLVDALLIDPIAPWGRLAGDPLDQRRLAGLLRHYEIKPGTHRFPDIGPTRGYERRDFEDAWSRYLVPANPPAPNVADSERNIRNNAKAKPISGVSDPQHDPPMLRMKNGSEPHGQAVVADVAATERNTRDGATT